MLIGLTYDLRAEYLAAGYGEEETAEFDRPDTIDSIENALQSLGYETDRIGHIRNLVGRLERGDRWNLVFNIAEGLRGIGRESQVPALLDAYEIPYTFSDPFVTALSLHKGMTKRVLRDSGVATTDFRIVASESDIAAVDLPFPLFVKPNAEGTAKGITSESKVLNRESLAKQCRKVMCEFRQPALVEPFLAGREFTTGVLGSGQNASAIGTLEVVLRPEAEQNAYTYVNKERSEELCDFPLMSGTIADECERLSLAAWRALGCRDAGRVDLRADASGRLFVLEINPLPGMHPSHSDLPALCTAIGMPYVELIRRIVESAKERIEARPVQRQTAQTLGRDVAISAA